MIKLLLPLYHIGERKNLQHQIVLVGSSDERGNPRPGPHDEYDQMALKQRRMTWYNCFSVSTTRTELKIIEASVHENIAGLVLERSSSGKSANFSNSLRLQLRR